MRAEDIATLETCEHLGVAPIAARNHPLYHRFLRIIRQARETAQNQTNEETIAQRDAEWSAALYFAGMIALPLTPDLDCVGEAVQQFEAQIIRDVRGHHGRQAAAHS